MSLTRNPRTSGAGLRERPIDDAHRDPIDAEDAPQRAGRNVDDVCGRSSEKPEAHEPVREAVVGQQLHRSIAAALHRSIPAERTPFFCGSFPVATAAQTASADVG